MRIEYTHTFSPAGRLFVAACKKGICHISVSGDESVLLSTIVKRHSKEDLHRATPFDMLPTSYRFRALLLDAVCQLNDYFEGRLLNFSLPLMCCDTRFRQDVWDAISTIPYGETRSYGWVANKIGRPGAARAVGTACGHNPIPIIIPCHRVIRSDGNIGEYSIAGGNLKKGRTIKQKLIELEQYRIYRQKKD